LAGAARAGYHASAPMTRNVFRSLALASLVLARAAGAADRPWEFGVSATGYFVPDEGDYVQPTLSADHDWLHLEARFNYEDRDAGSVWAGYNWSVGETLSLDVTPMFGLVFGGTSGLAPGYEMDLGFRRFSFYNEGEYVFDTESSENDFFYNWAELTFAPVEALRFGLVAQRTHAYQTARDVQRGLLVAFAHQRLELTACLFNPDLDHPSFAFAAALSF
jgi:hypothetical protein